MKSNPDAHTVASVLKYFFGQLPEPAIPFDFTTALLKVHGKFTLF